ncbi:MAG: aldo/keto reductase [Pseudoleptotrichia goodfellowii]|nr:aldo/keto reductase [Pseudoleptotrichia goodfellowii]
MKNSDKTVILLNGVKMPILGFGTWKIEDEKEAFNSVKEAIETGYTHIDTASFYKNEESVGSGIKEGLKSKGLKREDIFVTTKVWNTEQGYENTLEAFERSLKKLDTGYVDLYLIHWPVTKAYENEWRTKIKETWKAMEKLHKEGKIRAIGVSNFLVHHLEELLSDCEVKPMVDQIEFHPGHNQKETVEFCRKQNIAVEAWSPLGRGVVLDNEFLSEIADKYNKTVAQICLRWIVQQGIAALPKSTKKERIQSNFHIFDFELSEEDMKKITNMKPTGYSGSDPNLGRY